MIGTVIVIGKMERSKHADMFKEMDEAYAKMLAGK